MKIDIFMPEVVQKKHFKKKHLYRNKIEYPIQYPSVKKHVVYKVVDLELQESRALLYKKKMNYIFFVNDYKNYTGAEVKNLIIHNHKYYNYIVELICSLIKNYTFRTIKIPKDIINSESKEEDNSKLNLIINWFDSENTAGYLPENLIINILNDKI